MFIILRTKSFKEIILTSNEVKKSKQNCYVYKRSVKTNGDKKIFCENLLFNLRTPCPFFLNKKYGPLSRSALGGGVV